MKKVEENDYVRRADGFYKSLLSLPVEYALSIRRLSNDDKIYNRGAIYALSYEFFIWEKLIVEKALIDYNYVSGKDK